MIRLIPGQNHSFSKNTLYGGKAKSSSHPLCISSTLSIPVIDSLCKANSATTTGHIHAASYSASVVFSHSTQYVQVSRLKGRMVVVSAVVKLAKELAQWSQMASNITFDCMMSENHGQYGKAIDMEKPTRIKIVAKFCIFLNVHKIIYALGCKRSSGLSLV